MNEQLIVKNFGPIKDATVEFKRVTVFIGPTGGGKSTLAKLAAVFGNSIFLSATPSKRKEYFTDYNINNFFKEDSFFGWRDSQNIIETNIDLNFVIDINKVKYVDAVSNKVLKESITNQDDSESLSKLLNYVVNQSNQDSSALTSALTRKFSPDALSLTAKIIKELLKGLENYSSKYFPSERIFISSIGYSWPGFLRDDIGLPKQLVTFANNFSTSRKEISELEIMFLNIKYIHLNGQDFIKIPESETLFHLYETASGIQSVTPLLVLLEHLSRNTEQAQSFIIEEPELNLYPTAQQGLLNWLVEKCTKGENDLTITTHSPYILSGCNLLLEAYKVAQQRPDLEDKIAAIVPKEYWLNPDEFAAYYVADGTVKPITDERTHLIGGNELDSVSGDISDSFRKLLRLKKQVA